MERRNTQAPVQNKKKKKKKNRLLFWLIMILMFVAIILISAVISYNYVIKNYLDTSTDKPVVVNENEGLEFVIERGASTNEIVNNLVKQGLVKNETIFRLLSKVNGYDGTYKSGTHIVSKSLSYDELMRVLSSAPATRSVTIPEGKTFSQIVEILYDKKIIKDKKQFISIANTDTFDYDFLKDIPQRDNRLEGYLFPDTYEYDYNASDHDIIKKMLDNFDVKFKKEYRDKIAALPGGMTLDKIVTLASIIEREAKSSDDRYLISGVLYNRLTSKDKTLRKLQVDATIQYIMLKKTGTYKDRLLYDDLKVDDPYNTYLYEGLPPGPISCPGEAAIKAALNPVDTQYLYYVAKGDESDSHAFARTFKEHQANIAKYGVR